MAPNRFVKKIIETIEFLRSRVQASILRRSELKVLRRGTIRLPNGDEQNISTVSVECVSMSLVYVNKAGHCLTDVLMDNVLPEQDSKVD